MSTVRCHDTWSGEQGEAAGAQRGDRHCGGHSGHRGQQQRSDRGRELQLRGEPDPAERRPDRPRGQAGSPAAVPGADDVVDVRGDEDEPELDSDSFTAG